jgi:plasmid stabilization system protein ParE
VVELSPEARGHLLELIAHYEALDRLEAARNLLSALAVAQEEITANPNAGLLAPRPYPALQKAGRLWMKAGRYWIAYSLVPLAISGVFYDTADIPSRI